MTRNRVLSAAVALLAATLAVLAPAAPAQAHTALSRTTPAANTTVTKPVTVVTLTFTGLIKKPGTTVVVTGPDMVSYSDAAVQVVDKTITQGVSPLPVGTITVAWRTVAADGHPIQGSLTFTNKVAPPTPTTESRPTTPTPAVVTAAAQTPASISRASDDGSSAATWWLGAAGAVLVLALLGYVLWRPRRSPAGS